MVPHRERPSPGWGLPMAGWRCLLLGAAGLCLLGAHGASGQSLRGRLLDAETDTPVRSGILTLLTTDSAAVATALSDGDGHWRLQAPAPGLYLVAAEALGYEPWIAGPVELGTDDERDSTFHLRPRPIPVDPIEVRERRIREYLEHAGFFERQRAHFGHFVTPQDIERRRASTVSDLLTAVPGVRRVFPEGGAGPVRIQLRGSNLSAGGLCTPRVFVDGLMYRHGDARLVRVREEDATEVAMEELRHADNAMSLDDIGHPSTILAVEVYRSASQVPTRFGGTGVDTLCGVIVIWTRRGGLPGGLP